MQSVFRFPSFALKATEDKQVSGFKKTNRPESFKAGKLGGQEAGKLNYLRALQLYSLQASKLPSLYAISRNLFCLTPESASGGTPDTYD